MKREAKAVSHPGIRTTNHRKSRVISGKNKPDSKGNQVSEEGKGTTASSEARISTLSFLSGFGPKNPARFSTVSAGAGRTGRPFRHTAP